MITATLECGCIAVGEAIFDDGQARHVAKLHCVDVCPEHWRSGRDPAIKASLHQHAQHQLDASLKTQGDQSEPTGSE